MKKFLIVLLSILLTVCLFSLVSCGEDEKPSDTSSDTSSDTTSDTASDTSSDTVTDTDTGTSDPSLKNITGITFENVTVTYDGSEHKAEISGTLPSGVSCTYTCGGKNGNSAVNAGTYNVSATLSGEGYNSLTLKATLTINKAEITGVSLTSDTVTYDTAEHSILISGNLPEGVSCEYTYDGNKVTSVKNAKVYNVVATLSGDNYVTKALTATLTINKAEITGVTLEDDEIEYDGLAHSLQIIGNIPAEVVCTYKYNGEIKDEVTDSGEYTVEATLSADNYVTKVLTAVLTIKSTEEQLYSVVSGSKVYFQNPLDSGYLYVYDGTSIKKIASDDAKYLTSYDGKVYYSSKGLLTSSIKCVTVSDDTASSFYSANASYITTDGTYVYYAINNLINYQNTNGIYKYKIDAEEDESALKISDDAASYLTVVDGYIYYANGSEKGVLKKISVSGGTASVLTKDKVSDIVANGKYLYFNVITLTGNAIHKYSIGSNTLTKMTTDSGKNLTVVGDNLYYINNDLLTGNVFGDGVYSVALTSSGSLPGTKVVDAKVSSLTSDGTYLYYYLQSNKHLHKYNISTKEVTDIMQGFVPVDNTTPTGYVYAKEYNGEIYYIDPRDNGAIYKYNPQKRAKYKVIPDSCSEFYFNDGYLYYSSYIATNYDLYRIDLETFGSSERISKSRCDHLIFDGEYMYYIDNGVTYNTLRRMKPDSTQEDKEDEILYGSGPNSSVHFLSLEKIGDKIWFCINPAVGYKTINCYDISTKETTKVGNGEILISDGTTVFFFNQKNKTICSVSSSSATPVVLVSNVEVTSMAIKDNVLYYSGTCNSKSGLHSVNKDGTNQKDLYQGNCLGLASTSKGLIFYDSDITYSNDYPIAHAGTGKIYVWNGGSATLLF